MLRRAEFATFSLMPAPRYSTFEMTRLFCGTFLNSTFRIVCSYLHFRYERLLIYQICRQVWKLTLIATNCVGSCTLTVFWKNTFWVPFWFYIFNSTHNFIRNFTKNMLLSLFTYSSLSKHSKSAIYTPTLLTNLWLNASLIKTLNENSLCLNIFPAGKYTDKLSRLYLITINLATSRYIGIN